MKQMLLSILQANIGKISCDIVFFLLHNQARSSTGVFFFLSSEFITSNRNTYNAIG